MLYVKDVAGNEFPLQATITNELELNGNHTVSCRILPTKTNASFIEDISQMWTLIDHEGIEHKIVYLRKKGEGTERMSVEVKALPLFFDEFDATRIYEEYNEHMTAVEFFDLVFGGSSYTYALIDSFSAIQWEGVGKGETRLEMFKRGLERYGAEFRIVGNTVYLEALIGRDTSFMYRYKLNASNITQENDATAMYTYARGFGDFAEGEESSAKLKRSYTSPLASIIGLRHAPPVYDGRVTQAATLDAMLKTLVDESLIVSVSADIHDLRKQGYELAQPELGDRVFLIDERIGLDSEVRVHKMTITKDWRGNVVDFSVVFGSPDVVSRYTSNLNGATQAIYDILEGRRKLPFSVFDDAIVQATKDLKNVKSELTIPDNGGLLAINEDDPNKVVIFNSAGLGVSVDGANTMEAAVTGDGVIAERIIGQSIIGVNLSSIDDKGRFHVNGSDAEFIDTASGRHVTLSPDGLYGYNSGGDVRFQADKLLVTSAALGTSNSNVYLAPDSTNEVRVVDVKSIPSDGVAENYSYRPIRAQGLRFGPGANGYIGTEGEVRITSSGFTQSDGSVIYRPLRAGAIYSNNFVTTSTSLWMGTDSAMHVVNKGFVEDSSGTPIYRDIFAGRIWGSGFISQTDNAYIGANGELRVVNKGYVDGSSGSPIYRDVRASVYRGIALDLDGTTNAEHMYVRPSATGSLRVTSRGTTDSFRPVEASEFNVASSIFYKKNVEDYTDSATDLINSTPVRLYHLNEEIDDIDYKHVGLLVQEAPREIINMKTGDSIDIYAMASLLWKSNQELSSENKAVKEENAVLKTRVDELEQRMAAIEAKLGLTTEPTTDTEAE